MAARYFLCAFASIPAVLLPLGLFVAPLPASAEPEILLAAGDIAFCERSWRRKLKDWFEGSSGEPGAPAGVFNVASGRPTRIQELLAALLAHAKVRPVVETDPALWRATDSNAGDATRLVEATDWSPRHTLEETLGELLDDWRQRLAAEVS